MTPDVLLVRKLMSRQNLSRAESAELLETILRQDSQGWKILAFSVASQTKGETVEELLGMCDAMRTLTGDYHLDLAGRRPLEVSSAGGSGVRKINVSTLTALIVGTPEAPVMKHSFWKVTSITGSADALAAVGIFAHTVTLEQVQKAIDAVGVAYYSPVFVSPGLGNIVNFGQSLAVHRVGVSTPFHLLAPVFTPIPIQDRMFGLNNPVQFEMMTELFRGLGFRNGLIVRGFEGLDEASITSPSRVRGFRAGEDLDFVLLPEDVGLKRAPLPAVLPVDAESNYRDFVRIVHGVETGPKRDMVALNAGLALWLSEQTATIEEGIRIALERLASGEVAEKLTRVVELTGSPDVLRQARETYLTSA
jgi:anthranilate phosphoribosyltransferase